MKIYNGQFDYNIDYYILSDKNGYICMHSKKLDIGVNTCIKNSQIDLIQDEYKLISTHLLYKKEYIDFGYNDLLWKVSIPEGETIYCSNNYTNEPLKWFSANNIIVLYPSVNIEDSELLKTYGIVLGESYEKWKRYNNRQKRFIETFFGNSL